MVTVPELRFDAAPLSLTRQGSLIGNLPDFTSLLESLSTPTLKLDFDFLQTADDDACSTPTGNTRRLLQSLAAADDQTLTEQNFETNNESSFYDYESQLLKNIKLEEVPSRPCSNNNKLSSSVVFPQFNDSSLSPVHYSESKTLVTSIPPPVTTTEASNMGIDNETENTRFAFPGEAVVGVVDIKTEPDCHVESDVVGAELEELAKKMDRCCNQLRIKRDPTQWSCENVKQWADWIIRECYKQDYHSLQNFSIDGTTLCMLKQEDYSARLGNEQLGTILHIELDLWRNAYHLETDKERAEQEMQQHQLMQQQQQHHMLQQHYHNQQQQQQLQLAHFTNTTAIPTSTQAVAGLNVEDQLVYTDISHSTPLTSSSLSTGYTITSIPTPTTHANSVMSSSATTHTHDLSQLTLNEINQTSFMYNHQHNNVHHPHHHHHHQQQNTGHSSQQQHQGAYLSSPQQMIPSCAYRGVWGEEDPSSDDGSAGSPLHSAFGGSSNDIMMAAEDDHDSRASTPSNPNSSPTSSNSSSTKSNSSRGGTWKKSGAAVGHTKHTIHLWQFLRELLLSRNLYNNCIRWVDEQKGIFKIEDSSRVARLWGERKNRPAMNYDKLSRSIRQYYKKGIIKKTDTSKRLVYQFCEPYLKL